MDSAAAGKSFADRFPEIAAVSVDTYGRRVPPKSLGPTYSAAWVQSLLNMAGFSRNQSFALYVNVTADDLNRRRTQVPATHGNLMPRTWRSEHRTLSSSRRNEYCKSQAVMGAKRWLSPRAQQSCSPNTSKLFLRMCCRNRFHPPQRRKVSTPNRRRHFLSPGRGRKGGCRFQRSSQALYRPPRRRRRCLPPRLAGK
jgi:hypothetical protein